MISSALYFSVDLHLRSVRLDDKNVQKREM
jgi:hypothetical protein